MEVSDALALIQKIIEEHRIYLAGLQNIEQTANDSMVMKGLEMGKEVFVPGRLDQGQGLHKLSDLMKSVGVGLRAHFNREETALPGVVAQYGNNKMASTLRSILQEHEYLRNRIADAEKLVAELAAGKLTRAVWDATANDMRAHVTHTRKLIETHASSEQVLLHELEKLLKSVKA